MSLPEVTPIKYADLSFCEREVLGQQNWDRLMMDQMCLDLGAKFGYPARTAADVSEVERLQSANPTMYANINYAARVILIQQWYVPPVYSPVQEQAPNRASDYALAAGPSQG